jgi:hypothetical protein
VHDVFAGKRWSMVARNPDQQAPHERELRCQQREFPRHVGLRACPHPVFSIGELAAENGVDEKVFHDVRMAIHERCVESIVRKRVVGGERFERSARPVADARGEILNALHESGTNV